MTTGCDTLIETATEADLADIMTLEQDCFDNPWSTTSWASELNGEDRLVLVLRRTRRAVAVITFQQVGEAADLLRVAVDQEFRRQSMATKLMDAGMTILAARGVRQVLLEVEDANLHARRLYRKYGFVPVANRPHYYGRDRHGLVMSYQVGGRDE